MPRFFAESFFPNRYLNKKSAKIKKGKLQAPMKPLILIKITIPPVLITIGLVCFALVQNTQAVVPAPDGGYPRGNTAEGQDALFSLTNDRFGGRYNTAIGEEALYSNTTGSDNTAIGDAALFFNTTGIRNTAIGKDALKNNTTGHQSTAIGEGALRNSNGQFNIALGFGAGNRVTTANDVIAIGHPGANVSNSCFIGNIRFATTVNAAIPVLIDTADQLGTVSSSRRFKKEIKPMEKASEAILGLNPVTFHYKSDETNTPQYGLIAEEVAEVDPDLVVRDKNGEIYTVRYDAVNAMLLNEFLKEHRKVEEQQATISQLKRGMETMVARLREQESKIQKVSDQLEAGRSAQQVVLNNP
jgi:hypothetical protein